MFDVLEAQRSGLIRPERTAVRNPPTSSSWVSVPASKNRSMRESSASATISMSASRAEVAASFMAAGTGPSVNLPLASVAYE